MRTPLALCTALFLGLALGASAQEPTPRGNGVREFRKDHPCPSTGKTTGACEGFVVDHIVPLCWGGADSPSNLTWENREESYKKDVFERAACALKIKLEKLQAKQPEK